MIYVLISKRRKILLGYFIPVNNVDKGTRAAVSDIAGFGPTFSDTPPHTLTLIASCTAFGFVQDVEQFNLVTNFS